ncbi:MAG: hypothetical protein ABIQ12_01770 [Opitutaceae bacterium]
MNSLTQVLRANPGIIVTAALGVGMLLVLILVTLIVRGGGASLRPMVFMAVLMLPIALVLFIGELVRARQPGATPESTFTLAVRNGQFVDRAKLFGAEVSSDYVRDAKAVFPEFFAEAEHAELGIVGTGETVLVAQFPTTAAAGRAATFLWQTFRLTSTRGDAETGWRGKRAQNSDYIEILHRGRHLFFWTALTKEACAARRAASTALTSASELKSPTCEPLFATLQPLGALFQPTGVKVAGLLLLVGLYSLWFFKGSAWASSSTAVAGATVVSATELSSRLVAVNALDVPFRLERGERPNEFFATWRYADAKWVDHARAHGLRRTFRIGLVLDESAHTVRATDYTAGYDWSAGADSARLQWQAAMGIMFFQTEQRRVFGLQLDDQGRFKPELSYAYKFNLAEMKSPLIDAVTRAGWNWRPTVWQGPVWLRWLTE